LPVESQALQSIPCKKTNPCLTEGGLSPTLFPSFILPTFTPSNSIKWQGKPAKVGVGDQEDRAQKTINVFQKKAVG
jgi:hypothetical protein